MGKIWGETPKRAVISQARASTAKGGNRGELGWEKRWAVQFVRSWQG